MSTHPTFFADAEFHLRNWREADRKLTELQEPYNRLVDRISSERARRIRATAETGVLSELENLDGAAGDLATMEKARELLTQELHIAMRSLKNLVVEFAAPAFALTR